jgi:nitroreductase
MYVGINSIRCPFVASKEKKMDLSSCLLALLCLSLYLGAGAAFLGPQREIPTPVLLGVLLTARQQPDADRRSAASRVQCRASFILNSSSASSSSSSTTNSFLGNQPLPMSVEDAIWKRKACKRFRRADGTDRACGQPSLSDPAIIQIAYDALKISLRTPSAFNTQPYKVILVHSSVQKAAIAPFALGPNRSRVLDSDCTAVFLADRKIMLSFNRYRQLMSPLIKKRRILWKNLFYISIFSSGYPLPRFLAAPLSFLVRTLFGLVHFITRSLYPMPSLSSAETWASKQVCMVAMNFLLLCTSQGAATIPMEGLNASSIRRVLNIPTRYAIPLMISVGRPYYNDDADATAGGSSSSGVDHQQQPSPRYDANEVIYNNTFRGPMMMMSEEEDGGASNQQTL